MAIAIVSERIRATERAALEKEGFTVLICPPSPLLAAPISHHPDALMALLDHRLYCYEGYYRENSSFFDALTALCPHLEIHRLPDAPGRLYPSDCTYNLLRIGRHVFYNPKGLSPLLAEACEKEGFRLHSVHQGYAACTVCAIDGQHAITADIGMAKALMREKISVLKIREGGISLPPYAHGFIGGASGCHGQRVYFFGDISTHPDHHQIMHFLSEAGFAPISLSSEPLCDLGGILFIE